jgi:phytoene synthase
VVRGISAGEASLMLRRFSLAESYRWSAHLTRRTAKNFGYAFHVLPRDQHRAMEALYAFLRVTDDLADEPGETSAKRVRLEGWHESLKAMQAGDDSHPVHPALRDSIQRFAIPIEYLEEVIFGVRRDLEPVAIETFAELYGYCYQVASAVGLACIHIWGFRDERAKLEAEATGIAFQLTNILRDLGEDRKQQRVYLPREEWERFQAPPDRWEAMVAEPAFRDLLNFQIERAKSYYQRGEALREQLDPPGRAVFHVMFRLYRELLTCIERQSSELFRERISLSRWRKLSLLARAFPIRWGWC